MPGTSGKSRAGIEPTLSPGLSPENEAADRNGLPASPIGFIWSVADLLRGDYRPMSTALPQRHRKGQRRIHFCGRDGQHLSPHQIRLGPCVGGAF